MSTAESSTATTTVAPESPPLNAAHRHPRAVGAGLGALIGLALGVLILVASAATDFFSSSVNIRYGPAVLAPIAAGVAGAACVGLARRHGVRGFLAMALLTWFFGTLLWPFAAVVIPFATGQVSCIGIDSACMGTAGMTPSEVLQRGFDGGFNSSGVGLLDWYRGILYSPAVTMWFAPAIVLGAVIWTAAVREYIGRDA